jgi:hypothetical protein
MSFLFRGRWGSSGPPANTSALEARIAALEAVVVVSGTQTKLRTPGGLTVFTLEDDAQPRLSFFNGTTSPKRSVLDTATTEELAQELVGYNLISVTETGP